jgi:hypothetical protein
MRQECAQSARGMPTVIPRWQAALGASTPTPPVDRYGQCRPFARLCRQNNNLVCKIFEIRFQMPELHQNQG